MRALALVLCLSASGCFVVTRATYAALVKPDRVQLATEAFACSVVEENQQLRARVGLKVEHGPPQVYDEQGGFAGVRGRKFTNSNDPLEGRRFDGFRAGNIPCVMVESDSQVALGVRAWHFDGDGRREPRTTPITAADMERAAFLIYERARDRTHNPKLFVSVPPGDGRGSPPSFDGDDCIGCQNFSTGPAGTDVALPTASSPGGMAGFAFLLPITLAIDLAAVMEVSLICCGNRACVDAFMSLK